MLRQIPDKDEMKKRWSLLTVRPKFEDNYIA